MRDAAHPVNLLVPVVWFRSVYVALLGVDSPVVAARAQLALLATAVAVAFAVPCSLLGFRDAANDGRRYGTLAVASPRLRVFLARGSGRPLARAVASFVVAALFRSATPSLIARGLFLVGVALVLSGFMGVALRDMGYSAPVIPAQPLLAPAFVLPFFALVGLRLASAYPAELGANWIFQLTEKPGSADYAKGVRRAAIGSVVLPLLGLASVPYAFGLGPLRAAALLTLAIAVALVTVEWLFLCYAKVPFTCTYQPGKARLRVTWPKHAAVFVLYCAVLPRVAARVLASPIGWAVSVALLVLAWRLLVRMRERQSLAARLVFDDAAHSHLTALHLDWHPPAGRPEAERVV
jgi:hypothetical protein